MKKGLDTLKDDNIIDLGAARVNHLAIGGGFSGDENWLKELPKGTVFTCKRKNAPKDMLALDLYFIIEHKDKVSNVIQKIPTGQQADMFVDSLEFSRYYKFIETVATVELQYDGLEQHEDAEPTTETTDGDNQGAV